MKGDVVKKSVSDLLQMAKESASKTAATFSQGLAHEDKGELDRLRKLPKQDQIYEVSSRKEYCVPF